MNQVLQINLSVEQLTDLVKQIVVEALCEHKPQNVNDETKFITRKEAAKLLGVSLVTLMKWTKEGVITGYKIKTRVKYNENEVINCVRKIPYIKYRKEEYRNQL